MRFSIHATNYDGPVMHGNFGATSTHSDSGVASCALWFANPAAQDLFDASALSAADRARRSLRREREFKVSRALKAFTHAEDHTHSLSHSAGHAALLIAPAGMRVGVDLEALRPRDVLRIARFGFHEQEVADLQAAAEGEREELFYVLWTLKEALGKALQLNLLDALRECVFTREPNGWRGSAPTTSPWSAQVFRASANFVLAAAFVGVSAPPALNRWEWPPQRAAEWPVIAACATAREGAGAPPA
jgi:phosphopantetheinyl transferase